MPRSFSGRTKVFEAFYVGSIPALGAKFIRKENASSFEFEPKRHTNEVVAERQRHLTVHEDQVGSTPIHFANTYRGSSLVRMKALGSDPRDRKFKSFLPC